MLFSFHEFKCFWVFSLRLVSSFKPLWSEKMLNMISLFLNLLRLVLCPITWSIFENVPCAFKRMCILLLWDQRFCIYQLSPFDLVHNSVPQGPCWSSGRSVHCWQWGVNISCYKCVAVNIFLEVLQDFPCIFGCSHVGYIYVYNVYVFLMDASRICIIYISVIYIYNWCTKAVTSEWMFKVTSTITYFS